MVWTKRYKPPSKKLWSGRQDGPGAERFHEVVQLVDMHGAIPKSSERSAYAIVGFASDEGVKRNLGRTGASQGPKAIREALAKLPAHGNDQWVLYDVGDVTCTDGNLEEAQEALAMLVALLLVQNIRPIVLGGGHEVAWGSYLGLMKHDPEQECAILNFDAHYDIRPLLVGKLGTSGTSFKQMAMHREKSMKTYDYTCIGVQPLGSTKVLFDEAKKLGVKTLYAEEVHADHGKTSEKVVKEIVVRSSSIFLSLDMDVFAAAFAPGVSAPQPLGLLPSQLLSTFTLLGQTQKVSVFVVAEVSPPHDIQNQTAALAASMIATYLDCGVFANPSL